MYVMRKLLIVFLAVANFSPAAIGDEYVREGWPGEGTPRLVALNDQLVLHKEHDTTSDSRQLKYKAGWLITWDQTKVITKKSAIWTVINRVDESNCGTLLPGEQVRLLQYEVGGLGTFRVGDTICTLKVAGNNNFDKAGQRPRVEWWVRVLDNKKAPIGWLLVNAKQVELLPR
jgi:hypothetical protein